MKLLLTSAGVTNSSIAHALIAMMVKPVEDSKLAFVPTASNVETGDKGWVLDEMQSLRNLGFAQFDVVDISALSRQQWEPRLREADVIAVGGGCTPHLLDSFARTGAGQVIEELTAERVYVGISAGSIAAGNRPIEEISTDIYDERTSPCLDLVDLTFLPHLNSPLFPKSTEENIRAKAEGIPNVYALDDEGAVRVIDGQVDVITEGKFLKL